MPNSEFLTLDLGLPLGMLIEVEDAGGGSAAGMWYQKTRVMVTDALPGYSSYRNVQKGDILRAVTAYARRLNYSSVHNAALIRSFCSHVLSQVQDGARQPRRGRLLGLEADDVVHAGGRAGAAAIVVQVRQRDVRRHSRGDREPQRGQ